MSYFLVSVLSVGLRSEECEIVDVVRCDIELEGAFRLSLFAAITIAGDQYLLAVAIDFLGQLAVHLERKRHLCSRTSRTIITCSSLVEVISFVVTRGIDHN